MNNEVYIPDDQMPKCCGECKFADNYDLSENFCRCVIYRGILTKQDKRPSYCPLKPISSYTAEGGAK